MTGETALDLKLEKRIINADFQAMIDRVAEITQAVQTTPALAARFEIIRTIGSGAAGVVFQARDRARNDAEVALKILADSSAFDGNTLTRFIHEIKVLRAIRHPNLIEAYDFLDSGRLVAFTMEYVDGSDLGRLLRRKRKFTQAEIDSIFYQILSALGELHRHGVAHRDLKLENVLVAKDGRIKLGDLGIMKKLDDPSSTQGGILLGTTQYLPPEYIQGNQYDQRGDLYAVGLMLHECLMGKRWLQHKKASEVMDYMSERNFEFPKMALVGLPWKYSRILEKALTVDPEQRYQSAEEMMRDIKPGEGEDQLAGIQIQEALPLSQYAGALSSYGSTRRGRVAIFTVMVSAGVMLMCAAAWIGWLLSEKRSDASTNRPPSASQNEPSSGPEQNRGDSAASPSVRAAPGESLPKE